MHTTYLKSREYYENLYDKSTISTCREGEDFLNSVFSKLESKLPKSAFEDRQLAWYVEYSTLYFETVEMAALIRFIDRKPVVEEMMSEDKQKDERLAGAKLASKPYCLSCGKDMVEFERLYVRRDESGHNVEDILFMLKCSKCDSRRALWRDGSEWVFAKTPCERCGSEMTEKSKELKTKIITTYKCPKCGHTYDDTYKFQKNTKEPPDPYAELDRKRFCDIDEPTYNKLVAKGKQLERLFKLQAFEQNQGKVVKESELHETVQSIKKIKVAQLSSILQTPLKKAGYTKLRIDPPELNVDVIVRFSCLDDQPERSESNSKRDLKKIISEILENTNWRLTNEGVSSRVGYLQGRLRAFESDADLRKLANEESERTDPLNADKDNDGKLPFDGYVEAYSPEQNIIIEKIKIYHGKLLAKVDTVDNGTKRLDKYVGMTGTLVPELRIVIPPRDDDKTVPGFVRNVNFTQTTGGAPKGEVS